MGGGGGGRSFSPSMSGGTRSFNGGANVNRGNWSGNTGNWSGNTGNWNRGGQNWASTNNWNRSGNWNGNRNWNGNNWNGNGNWNNGNWNWNHNHEFHDNDFWWWGIAPLVGAFWGNWYPGYWDNGYYGYPAYYGYDYYAQPQYYNTSQPTYTTPPAQSTMTGAGDEYLNQAVSAFQSGNYREAMRFAGHAIVDQPQDPRAHAILSLAAFASGNYQAAAAEAHAVASINGVPSWSQIYGIYGDVDKFTSQLRQLEYDAKQHPQDAHAHFLLGFLYMAMGHQAEAQEQLAQAAQQMPNDRIAANLLTQVGGSVPQTASRTDMPPSNPPVTNQPTNQAPQQGPPNSGQPNGSSGPLNPPSNPPANSRGPSGEGGPPLPPPLKPLPASSGTPGGTET
jgi:hypothetical protein